MLLEISNDPRLVFWLNSVCSSRTNNTRELYTSAMRKYCNHIGLTPTQLIDEAEKESSLVFSKRKLALHIASFKNRVRETMSQTSSVTYLAAINSFYSTNEIAIPKSSVGRKEAPVINIANDLDIKDKDITTAFSISTPLMKLIIAIQYTSGLSMSDTLDLKAGLFKENNIKDSIMCLRLQRQKTKVEFHTFLSPTATKLSLMQIQNFSLEDNDFLICEEKGKQLKEGDFTRMFRELASMEIMKLKEPAFGEYNKMHSHNLRKMFFNTILKVGGWEMSSLAEYFMGHKIPSVKKAYFKADVDSLREEYKKLVLHFEGVLNGITKT